MPRSLWPRSPSQPLTCARRRPDHGPCRRPARRQCRRRCGQHARACPSPPVAPAVVVASIAVVAAAVIANRVPARPSRSRRKGFRKENPFLPFLLPPPCPCPTPWPSLSTFSISFIPFLTKDAHIKVTLGSVLLLRFGTRTRTRRQLTTFGKWKIYNTRSLQNLARWHVATDRQRRAMDTAHMGCCLHV